MPNLTKLEAQVEDETTKTVTLSPTSLNLCLALLDGYAWPWQWFGEDEAGNKTRLDDTELARAAGYQAQAICELLTEVNMIPVGSIMAFPSVYLPDGWLACDGQQYEIATYPALADVLGTGFGGDGVITFCVPDLGERYIEGWASTSPEYVAQVIGTKMQTLVPQHKHQEAGGTHPFYYGGSGSQSMVNYSNNAASSATIQYTQNAGEAGGVDQRPPSLVLNYMIYAGV